MKPFRFSLEPVLEYRREIEEEWEIRLARINGEYNTLLRQIEESRTEAIKALEGSSHAKGDEARSWGVYRWRMEALRAQLESALAAKGAERDRIRKKFLEVSRDRKVLTKLKEKKQDEYRKYRNKEEIKRLDDISAVKAALQEANR